MDGKVRCARSLAKNVLVVPVKSIAEGQCLTPTLSHSCPSDLS